VPYACVCVGSPCHCQPWCMSLSMRVIMPAFRHITSRHAPPSLDAGRMNLPPSLPTCADMSQPLPSPYSCLSHASHLQADLSTLSTTPAMHPPSHSFTPSLPPPFLTHSLGRLPDPLHPRRLGVCHLGADLHHGGRLRRLPAPALRPRHQGTSTPSLPPSLPPSLFNHIHSAFPPSPPSLPPSRPSKKA